MLDDDIQLPCPKCEKPAFTVRLDAHGKAPGLSATLTCGCTTTDRRWIDRLEAIEMRRGRIATDIHNDHLRQCPCERCRVSRKQEPTK